MARPARLAAQGLAVALVAGLLALLVWRVVNDNGKGVAQKLDDGEHPTAPAFDLSRLDGRGRIDLASLRGRKPIVLDFWASWCVPCIQESKRLEAARKEYGGRIAFIGVDTKDFSGREAVAEEARHHIPSVHDGNGNV
jgi:cytochrome c biogenesis protein CcmG/thiol:disulfide interchange protein DsbE